MFCVGQNQQKPQINFFRQREKIMERYPCVPPLSETQALLSRDPPPDFDSLRLLLLKRLGGGHRLASLQTSIRAFDLFMRSAQQQQPESPRFDFFSDLLPQIHSWALAYPSSSPLELPLLPAGSAPSRAALSRGTIRTLLANAFFLNVLSFHDAPACDRHAPTDEHYIPTSDRPQFGDISFACLYTSTGELAVQRLLCLLAYFALARCFQFQELEEEVCFERHALSESDLPNWASLSLSIDVSRIHIHSEAMENSDARCIMDFANKALHIHEIIPSATQEEVLFSACPEAFPGILFCDVLEEKEVIIIRNVRRLVEYKGYASTFKFQGFYPVVRFHDIIVADATYTMHFTRPMIERDLNKAYLAFMAAARQPVTSTFPSSLGPTKVSTSHWGCGAFRGDKHHKFLLQVCASALAGIQLDYSTFGDARIEASFTRLLGLISSMHHTIGSVYHAMSEYKKEEGGFSDYICRKLSQ